MASDIQRLRQQSLFNIAPQQDLMGGMQDMGYSQPMNYAPAGPMGGRYNPPPIGDEGPPSSPFDFLKPGGQTSPTFPNQGTMDPRTMQAPGGANPTNASPAQTLQEYIDAINQGYTPDFTDRDRLRKLMDTVPERKAPSFARTLVASALSTKAEDPVKTAEQVMQAPYLRDMASWKEKTEPFYKTAELENRQNVNERTLMSNAVTAKTNADRILEQGRQADQKAEIARQRAENDAIRARAYAAKNNGYTVMKAGDRIVAVDPQTNRRVDLGPSGGLDRETELDIMGEWGVKQAEARGAAAVQTAQAGASANNRDIVVIDGVQYQRNPDRSLTPVEGAPRGTPSRIGTPSQNRTGTGAGSTNILEYNRVKNAKLEQAWQTDATNKPWVKKIAEGKYDFNPRPVVGATVPGTSTLGFGGSKYTQEDVNNYDAFRKDADPNYTPPKTGGIGPGATQEKPEASAKPGLGASPATVSKGTGANVAPPAKPQPQTEEEKTRAAMRAKIAESQATAGPRKQAELEALLKDPNTPNQLRPIIQRDLDAIKQKNVTSTYKVFQKDDNNPNEMRRSKDGKAFEYSHDGGKTWGAR